MSRTKWITVWIGVAIVGLMGFAYFVNADLKPDKELVRTSDIRGLAHNGFAKVKGAFSFGFGKNTITNEREFQIGAQLQGPAGSLAGKCYRIVLRDINDALNAVSMMRFGPVGSDDFSQVEVLVNGTPDYQSVVSYLNANAALMNSGKLEVIVTEVPCGGGQAGIVNVGRGIIE